MGCGGPELLEGQGLVMVVLVIVVVMMMIVVVVMVTELGMVWRRERLLCWASPTSGNW